MDLILTPENIRYHPQFIKDLKKIDPSEKAIIQDKLDRVLQYPNLQNIKSLAHYAPASYRLKLGHYRILFTHHTQGNVFVFLRIRHRQDLY